MIWFGDFDAGKTVILRFPTYDSTGASITCTGLSSANIRIYKGTSTTARASANGITTVTDFAGITGQHFISIDTSNDSDTGFYSIATEFSVYAIGLTVATKSVSVYVGSFSLRNRSNLMPQTAGRTLSVTTGGQAGLDFQSINQATLSTTLLNIVIPNVTNIQNPVNINSNSDITAIKGKTDQMVFTIANQLNCTAITVQDKTNYQISGTLTTLDALNTANISGTWTYATRTLTASTNLLQASDVWSYTTRSLTDKAGFTIAGTKTTLDQLNDISTNNVWNHSPRTLTQVIPTAGDIWAYPTRSLTDKSGFYIGGILATALTETTSGNLAKNISYYFDVFPITLKTVNDTASSAEIWAYTSRTLTASTNLPQPSDIWTYSTRSLTDKSGFYMAGILGTLLTETNAGNLANNFTVFHNLFPTSLKTQNDVGSGGGGGGATAAEIWSYSTRSLTQPVDINSNVDIIQILTNTQATYNKLPASGLFIMGSTVNTAMDTQINNIYTKVSPLTYTIANQVNATTITNQDKTAYYIYSTGTKTTLDALNDISQTQVQNACTTALTNYGAVTQTYLNTRTLLSAQYATLTNQQTIITDIGNLNNLSIDEINTFYAEGTETLDKRINEMYAVLTGTSSGGDTDTMVFNDLTGTKPRVTALVNSFGDRLNVTLDGA